MVRYAIAMGIRLLCFVLAVVVRNWMTWVFLGLAVVLPYIAVTLANAGADRYSHKRDADSFDESRKLDSRPGQTGHRGAANQVTVEDDETDEDDVDGSSAPAASPGMGEVIEGEIVRDAGDDGRP